MTAVPPARPHFTGRKRRRQSWSGRQAAFGPEVDHACTIGRFLAELVGVFLAGVLSLFAMLILAAGAVLAWLIGCMSGLFLLIALAESAWWLHTPSHHAAVTALGYYGYAVGTFALIPVLLFLKEKPTVAGASPSGARRAADREIAPGARRAF